MGITYCKVQNVLRYKKMEMPNREFVEKLQKSDGILGPMSQGTATVFSKNSLL